MRERESRQFKLSERRRLSPRLTFRLAVTLFVIPVAIPALLRAQPVSPPSTTSEVSKSAPGAAGATGALSVTGNPAAAVVAPPQPGKSATSAPPVMPLAVPPGPNMPPINPNDPNVTPPPLSSILANLMDPFDYDPRGRRDPFGQPIPDKPMSQGNLHGPLMPLQRFDINQLSLTGILWNVRDPKAILKDPTGVIYIVAPGAKIGPNNGYVASIREGEIVIVETTEVDGRLVSTAQVVKMNR